MLTAAPVSAVVVSAVAELAAVGVFVGAAAAADLVGCAVEDVAHEIVILDDFETVADFVNVVEDLVLVKTAFDVVNFVAVVAIEFVAVENFVVATDFVAAVVTEFVGHVTETVAIFEFLVTVAGHVNAVLTVNLEVADEVNAALVTSTVVAEVVVHHSVAYVALVDQLHVVVASAGPHAVVAALTVEKSDVLFAVGCVVVAGTVVEYLVVSLVVVVSVVAEEEAGPESLLLTELDSPFDLIGLQSHQLH